MEAKRLERMRRFGMDIKESKGDKNVENNKSGAATLTLSEDTSKSQSELDAIKAARLARFGEVDPADLSGKAANKGGRDGNNGSRKRDKKRNQKEFAGEKKQF